MADSNIKSDDLILINRGGVDYQAKVSDLPIEDVDLSEYAKLDDSDQDITANDITAEGYFIGDGSQLTNLPIPDDGLEEAPSDGKIYGRKNKTWESMARYMPYDITTLPEL